MKKKKPKFEPKKGDMWRKGENRLQRRAVLRCAPVGNCNGSQKPTRIVRRSTYTAESSPQWLPRSWTPDLANIDIKAGICWKRTRFEIQAFFAQSTGRLCNLAAEERNPR